VNRNRSSLYSIPLSLVCFSLIACGGSSDNDTSITPQPAALCEGEVFASGTVSREFTPTTFNEPFIANEDSHVLIQLSTAFVDGPTTTLVEQDTPFIEIPFEFMICGDAMEIEAMRQGDLFIAVEVFNQAGINARVGDLVSESANVIEGPSSELEIIVSGLEDCDSPDAGGFCTTNQ